MTSEPGVVAAKAKQKDLSLEDVLELENAVHRSDGERRALEVLDRDFDKAMAGIVPKDEAPFRKAVFSYLLGRLDEAQAAMNRRKQNPLALFLLGRIAEERGDRPGAVEAMKAALDGMKGEPAVALACARALREAGEHQKASSELDKVERRSGADAPAAVRAEIAFQRGRLLDLAGEAEQALDLYEKALSILPAHAEAAFRMASILDLRGEDARAVELLEKAAAGGAAHAGAVMNLAMLYEDRGEHERAIACYRDVLRVRPADRKVRLFLDGAVESTEETYDELERKEQEKLDQILKTPVTEFELSIRSRNVLSHMKIRTLGDLVQKTEAEMLSYKNFGETSLQEIKQLLTAKGLRLGMARDEVDRRHKRERLALVMSDQDSRKISMPVSELNLSVRARKCMARLKINTVGDLVTRTAEDLAEMKNFGHTSLNEVRAKLAEIGLSLRPRREEAEEGGSSAAEADTEEE